MLTLVTANRNYSSWSLRPWLLMKALGIEKYRDRFPSQLSGGQQQRVALARMLAVSPGVLLLDEPLSNLDARLRLEMRAELKRIHADFGTTILFVTHDQWEAMTLATTIAVMNEGRLQQMGTPDDIYERPANRFVAEFVGAPPINIMEMSGDMTPLARFARGFLSQSLPEVTDAASMGIRPEALRLLTGTAPLPEGQFSVPATVSGVLPTGGSWIIELQAAGQWPCHGGCARDFAGAAATRRRASPTQAPPQAPERCLSAYSASSTSFLAPVFSRTRAR